MALKLVIASVSIVAIGSILLILGGVLGWVVIPKIIDNKVEEETRLEPDLDVYEKWVDIPVPIYSNFTFFDLINYEDFAIGEGDDWKTKNLSKVIPRFREVGPFVYREIRHKEVLQGGQGPHDTIYYKQKTQFIFEEELSGPGLTEDTKVTILNVPLITVLTLQDIHESTKLFSQQVVDSLISYKQTLFMKDVPVSDVLYGGYKIPQKVYATVEAIARAQNIPLPDEIMNGEFAFFRGKNNSHDDGITQVHKGIANSAYFTVIRMINGEEDERSDDGYVGKYNLNNWWGWGEEDNHGIDNICGMINGTDGTMFPPFVKKDKNLELYVPEICRSIYLEYNDTTKYENINGYRFKLPEEIFQTSEENIYNGCFCSKKYRAPLIGGECEKGLWKIFTCKAEVPIVMSKPHYLGTDEQRVEWGRKMGLHPLREEHDSFVDVEPYTGFPLRVHVRLQLNAEVQSFKSLPTYPNVYNTFPENAIYPVFWVDKSAELDEKNVDEMKDRLIKPLNAVNAGRWAFVGVGIGLILGGAGFLFFVMRRK